MSGRSRAVRWVIGATRAAFDLFGGVRLQPALPVSTPRELIERVKQVYPVRSSKPSRLVDDRNGVVVDVTSFMSSVRWILVIVGAFSGLSNLLILTGPFFMLQVYDRVLPSRSVFTLAALLGLATLLYLAQGGLDLARGHICVRLGRHLDETLSARIFESLTVFPLKARGDGDGLQPLRDLDQVRGFFAGGGPSAFFDLPWMPLYLIVCFLFHFWIGAAALAGALVLIGLTVAAELGARTSARAASRHSTTRMSLAAEGRRNAEVLQAMGIRQEVIGRWREVNRNYLAAHEAAIDLGSRLAGASRVFRAVLQSSILAIGACLVIEGQATAGIIIASSILTARALAPVEMAIANWKGFVAAREAASRLDRLLRLLPAEVDVLSLPAPTASLTVDRLFVAPPGSERMVLSDVSFSVSSGEAVGVIGPSGSGKSSLARALVGVWSPVRGRINVDQASLEQWSCEALGRHIGYLPQDVQLFSGSIALNIARFDSTGTAEAVVEAARAAGVHELILSLPEGYKTHLGEGGLTLSAGQRQRIGLARALYGDPFLLVLDEPTSNLDASGEDAFTETVLKARRRGGIVIVVAHRPKALESVDKVLVVVDGRVQASGPKDEVLRKVLQPSTQLNGRSPFEAHKGGRWTAR